MYALSAAAACAERACIVCFPHCNAGRGESDNAMSLLCQVNVDVSMLTMELEDVWCQHSILHGHALH
jgi:hypothetical protein